MALALYLDHNVPIAIAEGLALRGVDVLTAQATVLRASTIPSCSNVPTLSGESCSAWMPICFGRPFGAKDHVEYLPLRTRGEEQTTG